MALTITHLDHGAYGGGGSSLGTNFVTPAPNSLVLLTVRETAGGCTPTDTDSAAGWGATWSRVGAGCYSTSARLVVMKAQMGPSPGSGNVSYSWQRVDSATFPFMWSLDQITGHDPNTPIRQAVFGSPNAGQGAGSLIGTTLAAPKDTDSRAIGFFTLLSPVSNLNTQSGWSSLVANYTGGVSNERLHIIVSSPSWQAQTIVANDTTAYPIYGAIEVVAAPVVTTVTGSDTGGLTDAGKLLVSGVDLGTLTDQASAPSATLPDRADTAGFTEAATVYVPVTQSDTWYADETAILSSVAFLAEDTAATSDEAATVTATVTGTDAGLLVDAGYSGQLAVQSDAFSATEAASLTAQEFRTGTDAGTFTTTHALAIAAADTATATDASAAGASEVRTVDAADAATATEAAASTATATTADTGAAVEVESAADVTYAYLAGDDAGTVADATGTALAALTDGEQAAALDAAGPVAPLRFLSDADALRATDLQTLAAQAASGDLAGASEALRRRFELVHVTGDSDLGRLRDRILVAQLLDPTGSATQFGDDAATADEVASVYVVPIGWTFRPSATTTTRPVLTGTARPKTTTTGAASRPTAA